MEITIKGDQKEIEALIKNLREPLDMDVAVEAALFSLRDAFARKGAAQER